MATLTRPKRGRATSNLGAEIPGDTSVPAMATYDHQLKPLDSPVYAEQKALKPHSKRRKARSILRRWVRISLRHTWLNPLIIVLFVLGLYAINPGKQNPVYPAIFLSYPLGPDYPGGPNMYGKGKLDLAFVAFYTVVLSFTREFLMQRLIRPMAIAFGIRKRGKQARFMEQVYTAMYFGVFGPFGLYVMKYGENGALWYFNTTNMFEGFPHKKHEVIFKAYYLLQASYWAQQALVLMLQLEKPRKDFKELVLHHIVTLSLIGLSYRFHFAKMGIAVYITHDISDFFLATSKTLNYLDNFLVGPYFATFAAIWIYLRHYINLRILWATLTEFRTVGPYELDWEAGQYKCWLSQAITFGLLASLQAVNLFWLFLILRIAKNYVFTQVATDERSDDEGDETEDGITNVENDTNGNNKVDGTDTKHLLEKETGMDTDKPVLLLNGEPVTGDGGNNNIQAKSEGIVKQRRKG